MAKKLMFSEKANLLCTVSGSRYSVINGAWDGIRKGDFFRVVGGGYTMKITDWKEYTREEFDKAFPNFGY